MSKVEVLKIATLTGHKDCVYTVEGSNRGNIFFSSGGDGMVVKWDLTNKETGELIAKTNHSIYALHLLKESNILLVGENFAGIHAIDLHNKKEIGSSSMTEAAIFDIKSTKDLIIGCSGDGSVTVLSKSDLKTIVKLKLSDKSARCIAINPNHDEIAVGFSDHSLKIIDLKDFQVKQNISAHQNSLFTAAYTPDGRFLVTGSRDAHLKIWNVWDNYQLESSIVAHMFAINHVEFSPNGEYFATCSLDKSIKLWDAKEWRLIKVIDKARHAGHGTSVNKLYWSEYENSLVACSDDRTISVWNFNFN
jgi:WD40 repeat protein